MNTSHGQVILPLSIVADYDPEWPVVFEREKKKILDAIGNRVDGIEHVGSTSVPGMRAKPIIDILVAVQDLGIISDFVDPLRLIGYEYRPMNREIIPDTEFFRKGPSGSNTHHMRIVRTGSSLWTDYILFRDYLRTHPQARREYSEFKIDAYRRYGRKLPLEVKKNFVDSILAEARLELSTER